MKTTTRLMLLAVLALPVLAACNKEEAAPAAKVQAAPVAKPTDPNNDDAWGEYIKDQVTRHLDGAVSIYPYTLPAPTAEGYEGTFQRQVDGVKEAVARGGVEGTLMAFASPDSAKTADMIVASFDKAGADTMKGVRVLFIGDAADRDRAEAAVKPSGAKFEFAEAK